METQNESLRKSGPAPGGRAVKRAGIAIAGNILVDIVKQANTYPTSGLLADITSVQRAVGGCVPNTALDLARMGRDIPVYALGRVGQDEAAAYLLRQLKRAGVDTAGVSQSLRCSTSFSDVICARDTGERTFFHYRGANAEFRPEDIALDALPCKLLHIGYVLLLDAFDAADEAYGTVMARFLHDAQSRGMRTSIDAVSSKQGGFREKIIPALKYCDYAIMNEIEACAALGLPARDGAGRLLTENVKRALEAFLEVGVRRRAVIHCPEAGFCLDAKTGYAAVPSFRLPPGYIRGSVGAGDAFCAGCLRAAHQEKSPEEMLALGAAAAAACLAEADAVSGMKTEKELYQIIRDWEKRDL